MSAALLDPADHFHVGVVVPDVPAAMEEMSSRLGLRWRRRIRGRSVMRAGGAEREVPVDAVYAVQGPPYVELVRAVTGSVWSVPGLHHLGYWSDDVSAGAERLSAAGAPEVARFLRAGRVLGTYHRLSSGLLVELIDRTSRLRILAED